MIEAKKWRQMPICDIVTSMDIAITVLKDKVEKERLSFDNKTFLIELARNLLNIVL